MPSKVNVMMPNQALSISPSATQPDFAHWPDQDVFWRTVPSDSFQAPAMAALVARSTELLRANGQLGAEERPEVALVWIGSTWGDGIQDEVDPLLRMLPIELSHIEYPEDTSTAQAWSDIAKAVNKQKPHIVVGLGTDEFDDVDLLTLRTFAGQAGVAVHNVRVHEEAQRLSLTDPLTGLWNYRYLRESLRREVERASRFGRMLTVLVLLSAGCSSVSPPSSPPFVEPPRIPALPLQGRQPPTPPFCLPTCSAALEKELGSWESSLTLPMPAARPASDTPTSYSLPSGTRLPSRTEKP